MVNCVYLTVPAISGSMSAAYGATMGLIPGIRGELEKTLSPSEIYPLVETYIQVFHIL